MDDVDRYIEGHTGELVELAQTLVRYDTTSVDLSPGSEHRTNDEAALQAFVAEELRRLGAEVDQWEPDAVELAGHPMLPPWHHWENRPQTVGLLRGVSGGRSLLVNGHVDVVAAGDEATWTSPPFAAELVDGRIVGRGACDMKGGIAAALFALRALRETETVLAGDVIVEIVTDEETCAMGTIAAIGRGYRADAGLVPEPTGLDLWIATRGLLHGSLSVTGRSAHAEMNQPSWQEGGGVNAISRALPLLSALEALSADWAGRPDKRHPLLGTPLVQPTIIRGGAFISNVPERCEIELNATYLPANADEEGYGSVPRAEIERAVAGAAAQDDWLRAHPPAWSWFTDYPPCEIDPTTPIIDVVREASAPVGIDARPRGIDTTYDGALLSLFAETPSPAFGPGTLDRAHAPDEWIGVDELVLGARLYARVIAAWCGAALDQPDG
jgi:acetylornithine deacetylase